MKTYTVIHIDSRMSGSHRYNLTLIDYISTEDDESLKEKLKEIGIWYNVVYVFEGKQETLKEF